MIRDLIILMVPALQLTLSSGELHHPLLNSMAVSENATAPYSGKTDLDPPVIHIESPYEGMIVYSRMVNFVYHIDDANFRRAFYSINGGTKITITEQDNIQLDLSGGSHVLYVLAMDYTDNISEKEIRFSVFDLTGLSDQKDDDSELFIFPNPATAGETITLQKEIGQEMEYKIHDTRGGMVLQLLNGKTGISQMTLPELRPGIYVISGFESKGRVLTGQLIVK